MTAKELLQSREASLSQTLDQLTEQYQWAQDHGYPDLRDAYTEGQRLILDRMGEVQKALKLMAGD